MSTEEHLLHGTCIAFGRRAALFRGPSGCGKSDLALRTLSLFSGGRGGAKLVADDQVRVVAHAGMLKASAPVSIAGRLEVRGIGIVPVAHRTRADLVLLVDLVASDEVERMPPDPPDTEQLLGLDVALMRIAPFDASAPVKLKLALTGKI